MANKNTKNKIRQLRKTKKHFHGSSCITDFELKHKNPDNKRKQPYRGGGRGSGRGEDEF